VNRSTPSPELLAPAGGFDAACAAFQYGADAVYAGLPRFSARAEADNLTPETLKRLAAYARSFSPAKRIYITLNTLLRDDELADTLEGLDAIAALGLDGVIIQDLGLARLIARHFPSIPRHASTQLAVHNIAGARALAELGFTRVVTARELTLDEAAEISRASGLEVEIFVHGALCYSYSGLCLYSALTAERSGNRGRCAYGCREPFTDETGVAGYPFSMRDLALAEHIRAVTDRSIASLKIEGRMKSPLYVACVTRYYRCLLDNTLTPETARQMKQDLQTIFSRPWTPLYALDADADETSIIDPVSIGHRGAPIGRIDTVSRDRDGARWLRFTADRPLERFDGLQIDLPDGGRPFGFSAADLRHAGSHHSVFTLPAGTPAEVRLPDESLPQLPPGAQLYCSSSQAVKRAYAFETPREALCLFTRPADVTVTLAPDGLHARAIDPATGDEAEASLAATLTPARQPEQTREAVCKAFARAGDGGWRADQPVIIDPDHLYAPPSRLNELRRTVFDALETFRAARQTTTCTAVRDSLKPSADDAPSPPAPPCLSLKIRLADALSQSFAAVRGICDEAVLLLPHEVTREDIHQLTSWVGDTSRAAIRLALPQLARAADEDRLRQSIARLADTGWPAWECADLAGALLLRETGKTLDLTGDWSCYALNRQAALAWREQGIRAVVVSPEFMVRPPNPVHPTDEAAQPIALLFQHAPLFISQTRPCMPGTANTDERHLTDRRGRALIVHPVNGCWITVAEKPWQSPFTRRELLAAGCPRARIDLSLTPPSLLPRALQSQFTD